MYNGLMLWIINLIAPIIERPIMFGVLGGIGLFFWLSFQKREREILAGISGFIMAVGFFWLGSWFFVSWFTPYNLKTPAYLWGGSFAIGFILAIFGERKLIPILDKGTDFGTKKSALERDQKTDIRELVKDLVKIDSYDPEKYFKRDAWFFGLDNKKKPVYFEKSSLGHILVTGKSGSGKSVVMGVLTYQAILKGETVVIIDPKQNGDAFFPHVMAKAAKKSGKRFVYIDLRKDVAQINIMADGTRKQNELLLQNILSLDETGTDGDYFKGFGRDECFNFSQNLSEGSTIADYYTEYGKKLRADKNTIGFAQKLGELARITSINARGGLSLKKCIDHEDVIYIAGDWEDISIVKAKRMVLARIIQIISQRDNDLEEPKPVCIVADELKFQVSAILSNALTLIRDKGAHFILGCQTIANLRDCPSNMDKDEFQKGVLTNCDLKFTYRLNDVETADFFADLSGEILVDDEIRHLDKTLSLAETVSHGRQVRQTEKSYFDRNTLLALPENCGILFDSRLARMAHVSPIKVNRSLDTKNLAFTDDMNDMKETQNTKEIIFEDLD